MTFQNPPLDTPLTIFPPTIALFLGVSIPSLILGRAVFAVLAGISILLILKELPFATLRQDLKSVWGSNLGLLLILVFLLGVPSLFVSEFTLRSFEALLRTFLFCGMGVLVWSYFKFRPDLLPLFVKSLTYSALFSICFAFLVQYYLPELYWFVHLKGWRSDELIGSLKGYGAIVVFMFPLLLLSFLNSEKPRNWFALVGVVAFLTFIIAIENRAAIAGLLALVLCVGLSAIIRNRSKFQIAAAGAIIIACFSGALIWLRVIRDRTITFAPEGDYFLPVWLLDFERQTIWTHAFKIGMTTPWFGRGPNTINFAPGADKHLVGTHELKVIPAHPHNWVVELFAEVGVVCLLTLIVFLCAAAATMILSYRRSGQFKYLAAIAIFAGYWSSGLFNFSFWAAWWQLGFILSMAFALSMDRNAPPHKTV